MINSLLKEKIRPTKFEHDTYTIFRPKITANLLSEIRRRTTWSDAHPILRASLSRHRVSIRYQWRSAMNWIGLGPVATVRPCHFKASVFILPEIRTLVSLVRTKFTDIRNAGEGGLVETARQKNRAVGLTQLERLHRIASHTLWLASRASDWPRPGATRGGQITLTLLCSLK